jgi:hypothetical protein
METIVAKGRELGYQSGTDTVSDRSGSETPSPLP